jgi:hypothetical protein
MELGILTTAVGRRVIQETYSSLLAGLDFDGRLHVGVVIDPAYGIEDEEIVETISWLEGLPSLDPRIGIRPDRAARARPDRAVRARARIVLGIAMREVKIGA